MPDAKSGLSPERAIKANIVSVLSQSQRLLFLEVSVELSGSVIGGLYVGTDLMNQGSGRI